MLDWKLIYVSIGKRRCVSQRIRSRESSVPLFQDYPGPSSQPNMSLQQNTRISRKSQLSSPQNTISRNMDTEEEMQLVSCVIKYLLLADRNKHPIQKSQIIKNVLNGNGKQFHSIMDTVKKYLLQVNLFLIISPCL